MGIGVYLDEEAMVAINEVRHIYNALFGVCLCIQSTESDNCLQIHTKTTESGIIGRAVYKPKCISLSMQFNKEKTVKQNVAKLFLKAMYDIEPGNRLPWGILTGIRPMKLYRKLMQKYNSMELTNHDLQESYLLSDHKIALLQEIYEVQQPLLHDYHMNDVVSLYIGVPYCPSKCSYCTFPSYIAQDGQEQQNFFEALLKELDGTLSWLEEHCLTVSSVYIGGGTPSTLTAQQTENLFQRLAEYMDIDANEVTFEAGRPDTITLEKLKILKRFGVNRISINPQTFNERTLLSIGRKHTSEDIVRVYGWSKELDFAMINMDIIIGLPDESKSEFQKTLATLEQLSPDAVTVHTLALKSKSKLNRQMEVVEFNKQEIKEMVDCSQVWARANAYIPYYLYRQKNIAGNFENIGYAKSGSHSIYNILIMEEIMSIIGVGCGAVSKLINGTTGKLERFANPVDPKYYTANIDVIVRKKRKHMMNILTK